MYRRALLNVADALRDGTDPDHDLAKAAPNITECCNSLRDAQTLIGQRLGSGESADGDAAPTSSPGSGEKPAP